MNPFENYGQQERCLTPMNPLQLSLPSPIRFFSSTHITGVFRGGRWGERPPPLLKKTYIYINRYTTNIKYYATMLVLYISEHEPANQESFLNQHKKESFNLCVTPKEVRYYGSNTVVGIT